jgi:uncharacterized protein with ParB-like and HNH nuclease domain
MQASETKLQPIIEGTKQYVVPLFQRSYSWEKKEWDVLWNDLSELCETDNSRTHFLGSMVTMPTNSVPEGVTKYLLIDGQQRLTTIFILLAVLRDRAMQSGQKQLADEIGNTLLVNPYEEDIDYYKLQPTQVDRQSFHELIHSDPLSTQDKITNAYTFFQRKLQEEDVDIRRLKKVISKQVSVVSIVLGKDDDPHLVFESLNAKGRPLTQSDLIRNYFFMKIHVDEQERIHTKYWEPMQHALRENLTECIRHYLMKDGTIVKQVDVYFYLKDLINQGDALAHLKDLARFAGYYRKLLKPEEETNKEVQHTLQRLKRLEVTTVYPFLLNCYGNYDQHKMTASEFVAILNIIENFIIRRFVCNVSTKSLNKIFAALCSQMANKGIDMGETDVRFALQTKGYPKNAEFRVALSNAKLYGAGDRATKTKLMLEALEESFQHKEAVPFEKLTIEHVMPQTFTAYWQNYLGEDWETTRELLLHTLGNLTLTAYNSELSNDTWEAKKELLSKSHIGLNEYFKDKRVWKRENIEQRSADLADIALYIWPYFGDEKSEQLKQKTVTGTTPKTVCILGQTFVVRSWRDVLERTMNTIAELEPEKFEQIIQQYPRFVGIDKKKFKETRVLKNGIFIEVNLSALEIQRFCFQSLTTIELSSEDLIVEVV